MKLKREFFGYRLRRRRFYALRRKFLDALAPRRATNGAEKPASWVLSFYNFHERSEFTSQML